MALFCLPLFSIIQPVLYGVNKMLRNNNLSKTNKMHFSIYEVFYSLTSNQHVSTGIVAIFRVILLQEHSGATVVSCIGVTA